MGKPPTLIGADLSPLGLFVPFFRYSCATLHFLPLRLRPQGSPRHPLSKNPIKKRSVFTPKSRSILRPRIFGEFSENFQEPFSANISLTSRTFRGSSNHFHTSILEPRPLHLPLRTSAPSLCRRVLLRRAILPRFSTDFPELRANDFCCPTRSPR